ncbi:hypothetical protein CLPU_1c00070 [Gottschalkia purinilytica]|uniref:Uncharacterized protein n=1 Tax=Gottschalkia purinilytica TaxID=1503 RepID=A0A0L0WED6_GOTPU|nr:hypothetical protein [Gottschalkia purinilytica]KNF09842.1 hypothetical protein CLPU_1c00070 [Gottschalkia purinilytica]
MSRELMETLEKLELVISNLYDLDGRAGITDKHYLEEIQSSIDNVLKVKWEVEDKLDDAGGWI